MSSNYYELGSANFICDKCGQKWKTSQRKKEWNGLIVCERCYDPKHPVLEPLPAVIDAQPIPDSRPRPTDINVAGFNEGQQVWGSIYRTTQGLVSNINWEGWDTYWGDELNVPWNAENFPLR